MTPQSTDQYLEINKCRICKNDHLVPVTDLGRQCLTGVFPRTLDEPLEAAPLELVKCHGDKNGGHCGLVQLRHSYMLASLYGDNYGYRSGLNRSMIEHLHLKVQKIMSLVDLNSGDIVLDIGSNDSTLLQAYPATGQLVLIGIDPTGKKFKDFYPSHIELIPDFFSAELFSGHFGARKAKVITSIAMFYDLESPLAFMNDIYDILADDGIWVFEQSYIGSMLENTSYDTICHEHLEYYGLKQIKWMTDKIGFKIIDIELNEANGGSFSITVAKKSSPFPECASLIESVLQHESQAKLDQLDTYSRFNDRIRTHKEQLMRAIAEINECQKKILGYAASTKGNVILQYCEITSNDVPYIVEVNQDKVGCYTPGSGIPIISEAEAKDMNPDVYLALAWHFKRFFIDKEFEFLKAGGKFLLPLPNVEILTV